MRAEHCCGPTGRCCRVFVWFKYCDDPVLFPDVPDSAVGVVANVCEGLYSLWA